MNQKGQLEAAGILSTLGGFSNWFGSLPPLIQICVIFGIVILFGGTLSGLLNPILIPAFGFAGIDFKFEYLEILIALCVPLGVLFALGSLQPH
jgi:hypothetical protein